jgi:hypothetical protein
MENMEKTKTNIYIDGANLHRAAVELNFEIDYKKFRGWLRFPLITIKNVPSSCVKVVRALPT